MHSNQQKLDCAKRELKMRIKAYPGYIQRGILTPEKAEYETEVMRSIVKDYQRLVDEESGVLSLFKD